MLSDKLEWGEAGVLERDQGEGAVRQLGAAILQVGGREYILKTEHFI